MTNRRALYWILEHMPGNVENELLAASRALVRESKFHMPRDIQDLVTDWDKIANTIAQGGIRILPESNKRGDK